MNTSDIFTTSFSPFPGKSQGHPVPEKLFSSTGATEDNFPGVVARCGVISKRELVIQRKRLRFACTIGEIITEMFIQYPHFALKIIEGPDGAKLANGAIDSTASVPEGYYLFGNDPGDIDDAQPPRSSFEADLKYMVSHSSSLPLATNTCGRMFTVEHAHVDRPCDIVVDILYYNILCHYPPMEFTEWDSTTGQSKTIYRTKDGTFNMHVGQGGR